MGRLLSLGCAALICALLSGCGGTTTAENAVLETSALPAAKSRVKIYRTNEFVAGALAARVLIDGREVASIAGGGSTVMGLSPGPHKIVVDGFGHPNAYTLTLEAKPRMLYTLEISPRTEAAVVGAAFGLVGLLADTVANENGGTFQIRLIDEKPVRG